MNGQHLKYYHEGLSEPVEEQDILLADATYSPWGGKRVLFTSHFFFPLLFIFFLLLFVSLHCYVFRICNFVGLTDTLFTFYPHDQCWARNRTEPNFWFIHLVGPFLIWILVNVSNWLYAWILCMWRHFVTLWAYLGLHEWIHLYTILFSFLCEIVFHEYCFLELVLILS